MRDSQKSERLLATLGVTKAMQRGETEVFVGPIFELRRQARVFVRLLFHRDDERRLCVGFAQYDGKNWNIVESEPYSMRAYGYWERRLKRIGDYVGDRIPEDDETES